MGRALPHLFHYWQEIIEKIRASRRVILFLDFDGTLVHIAPRPELVHLDPHTRQIIGRLARRPNVTLGIVSGRRRCQLQNFFGDPQVQYLGLYGWERDGNLHLSPEMRDEMVQAHEFLSEKLASFPGVWIEHKEMTLSVHLKGAKPAIQSAARKSLRRFLPRIGKRLHAFENLRDVEVLPRSILDKGAAVRDLLSHPDLRSGLAFYAGDDFSDEPAFSAVRDGVSVLVAKRRPTHAKFCLRGPAEVAVALSRLEEALP